MENPIVDQIKRICAFRVDADDYDWFASYPDMVFEIILDAPPTQEQTAIAAAALVEFAASYNKRHFFRPIHYVSDLQRLPKGPHPRGIYIHVDFGNSSPKAVVGAMEALQNTNLPIFRVALQW